MQTGASSYAVAHAASSAPFHNPTRLAPASLMRALVSPTSSATRGDTDQFVFHFEKPAPLLLVSELAEEWDYSETHIIHLIEGGELLAFTINTEEPGKQKHPHYRIVRLSAEKGRRLTASGLADLINGIDGWLLPVERFGRRNTLRVDQCAAALRISPRQVRNLYDAAQLGARNLGQGQKELSLRVPRAELIAFVKRRLQLSNNL